MQFTFFQNIVAIPIPKTPAENLYTCVYCYSIGRLEKKYVTLLFIISPMQWMCELQLPFSWHVCTGFPFAT